MPEGSLACASMGSSLQEPVVTWCISGSTSATPGAVPTSSRSMLCRAHVASTIFVTFEGSRAIFVKNTQNQLLGMPNAFSTTLRARDVVCS